MKIKNHYRIVLEMRGKNMVFLVEKLTDIFKKGFWPWSKPVYVGKEWVTQGEDSYIGNEYGGVEYVEPFIFTTRKKAEEYIKNVIKVNKK